MKFRTLSRLIYLKKARHHRGHGIHSPFLFRLITTVIENRSRIPEYSIFRDLKKEALRLLNQNVDPEYAKIFDQCPANSAKPRKIYRKVELPLRYGKVIFRLIREFKPTSVISYGPTLGVHPAIMALANKQIETVQITGEEAYRIFCSALLSNSVVPATKFLSADSATSSEPEFIFINYPYRAEMAQIIAQRYLKNRSGNNDTLIIRGIHESKKMESVWLEIIGDDSVRVSLDLFEIGIALFRKGLQKENFILRF